MFMHFDEQEYFGICRASVRFSAMNHVDAINWRCGGVYAGTNIVLSATVQWIERDPLIFWGRQSHSPSTHTQLQTNKVKTKSIHASWIKNGNSDAWAMGTLVQGHDRIYVGSRRHGSEYVHRNTSDQISLHTFNAGDLRLEIKDWVQSSDSCTWRKRRNERKLRNILVQFQV